MAVDQQALLNALQAVTDPNTGRDFVSTKAVKNLQITDGDVAFDVELGYPAKSQIPALRRALIAAAKAVPGVDNVSTNLVVKIAAHAVQRGVQLLPQVKNIVAVASGKGGVGKTSMACAAAIGLAERGDKVLGALSTDKRGRVPRERGDRAVEPVPVRGNGHQVPVMRVQVHGGDVGARGVLTRGGEDRLKGARERGRV